MPTVSPQMYAASLLKAGRFQGQAWLDRCDVLFVEQRFVFLELATFARDGATDAQILALMNCLSTLQHLARSVSETAAHPILQTEFAPAVERAWQYFHAATSDDPAHEARMHRAWWDSVAQAEPVLWAGCVTLLRETGIMDSSLAAAATVTLYAVTDCYSRRLSPVTCGAGIPEGA